MSETTVISVRGQDRAKLLADPNFVYVGRRCAGWPASIWGNPFRVGVMFGAIKLDTPEKAVSAYRGWLRAKLESPIMQQQYSFLRGKTLGCWCGSWRPGEPRIQCHAVVLAELANKEPN